ncbi:DNA polymerase III subunit psi [Aeromonas cavernicola]|uniref:DNA polymerase III subunit psi n=1 Tax=Aeromonas cavernicola TaxID=1006623 RepID=A0A2H9U240_9GAMM|nr:DNA polymerase III subunit psi [Aeromonas cavernicola]PJG58136.1 hypothetical protein CUC53_14015 [Aeromonas cavernicola]
MLDPARRQMLARMGIQRWQLRPSDKLMAQHHSVPANGKLWLVAASLPPAPLLVDICQWLGIRPEEVALLTEPPAPQRLQGTTLPLLWLTSADPRWPMALVCPLNPDAGQKRALWQQLRQCSVS